jgi:hypothetical protein
MRKHVAPLLVALLVPAALAADDRPPLQTILERVSDYVVRYQQEISGVVAEERYVQDADKSDRPFVTHRELKSDLLLVRTAGVAEGYVQFRDVFEVDGDPVRDRTDRLATLFTNPSENAKRQAAQIMNESARYNIGSVERNINVPLIMLMLLDPVYQPHFKYSASTEHKGTPRGLPKTAAFTLPGDTWELDFEETMTPTVIQGDKQDAKSHGRVWVDPETSRVLITEIVNEAKTVRTTIRVSFQSPPLAGFLLPVEMRETYVLKGRFYTLEGAATYSNYRRFTVDTVEQIADPASAEATAGKPR